MPHGTVICKLYLQPPPLLSGSLQLTTMTLLFWVMVYSAESNRDRLSTGSEQGRVTSACSSHCRVSMRGASRRWIRFCSLPSLLLYQCKRSSLDQTSGCQFKETECIRWCVCLATPQSLRFCLGMKQWQICRESRESKKQRGGTEFCI